MPFYASVNRLPRAWTGTRAFTVFRAVCRPLDKVKRGEANTYHRYFPLVHRAFAAPEHGEQAGQAAVETEALRLHGSERKVRLTSWSLGCARRARDLGLLPVARTP